MIHQNILSAIGNTPIVRLNRVSENDTPNIFVKCEFMNPGGSIKDRIGWYMIEDAEKAGKLTTGGTVVECTSGNTGFALAIACAIKGYRSVFVLPDKMSMEKINALRAFGAEVVVTPTDVPADDPRSYYSVAKKIARDTPNSVHLHQYDNLSNRQCHYEYTGPEIFRQFPEIDVFVAGIGTGGTVCGIGKFLKNAKPSVKVLAVDTFGSIVTETFKTGTHTQTPRPYLVEGIGEDFIPKNYDFSVIDDMVQVGDAESLLMTQRLLREEGLYSGTSSGAAVAGALKWLNSDAGEKFKDKNVLVVLPDSGNRYLSKVFNDEWMREKGFLL